jgi:hypothetical protein
MDTLAYDYAKELHGYEELFKIHFASEALLSRARNPKISQTVSIKHEYIEPGTDPKGLFSIDKTMAIIFVFDYKNYNSLENIIELYQLIKQREDTIISDEKKKSVKLFICNKYENMVEDIPLNYSPNEVHSQFIYDEDTRRIHERLKMLFGNSEEVMRKSLFFTSAKYDLGLNYFFVNLINEIFQKELHKKGYFENVSEGNEKRHERGGLGLNDSTEMGFLCCKQKRTKQVQANEDKTVEQPVEILNFKDDEDEPGYDGNEIFNPFVKEEEENNNKNKCFII